jgi:hypothetical protein
LVDIPKLNADQDLIGKLIRGQLFRRGVQFFVLLLNAYETDTNSSQGPFGSSLINRTGSHPIEGPRVEFHLFPESEILSRLCNSELYPVTIDEVLKLVDQNWNEFDETISFDPWNLGLFLDVASTRFDGAVRRWLRKIFPTIQESPGFVSECVVLVRHLSML